MSGKRRKAEKRKQDAGKTSQEVLVKGLNHPVRVKALTILTDRVASPKEISEEVGEALSNVAYHVRVLDQLGLIEIVEEETVRGSVAHFYKAVERPLLDNPDWEKLDPSVRSAMSGYFLETLVSDASRSLALGIMDRRDERHLTRTPLVVDEQGWSKVLEIQKRALNEIMEEQAAAAGRMTQSGDAGLHAVAALMCFEVQPGK